MVSFNCDGCGDVIKKPKLDQHFQRCRTPVTCLDCSQQFASPAQWKGHISCVSEAEKYERSVYRGGQKKSTGRESKESNPNASSSSEPQPAVEGRQEKKRKQIDEGKSVPPEKKNAKVVAGIATKATEIKKSPDTKTEDLEEPKKKSKKDRKESKIGSEVIEAIRLPEEGKAAKEKIGKTGKRGGSDEKQEKTGKKEKEKTKEKKEKKEKKGKRGKKEKREKEEKEEKEEEKEEGKEEEKEEETKTKTLMTINVFEGTKEKAVGTLIQPGIGFHGATAVTKVDDEQTLSSAHTEPEEKPHWKKSSAPQPPQLKTGPVRHTEPEKKHHWKKSSVPQPPQPKRGPVRNKEKYLPRNPEKAALKKAARQAKKAAKLQKAKEAAKSL